MVVMLAKFLASLKFNDPGRLNAAVLVTLKIRGGTPTDSDPVTDLPREA
jgi:hypothetical protein